MTGLTIPGAGMFRTTFDQITIYADVDKATLVKALPEAELSALGHAFRLEHVRGKHATRIKLICLPDRQALKLLKRYERHLGTYRVTSAEIAADDYDCGNDVARAKAKRDALFKVMGKRNHQRGYLTAIDRHKDGNQPTPNQLKKHGLIAGEFTVYFEDEGADLGLKVYLRREKLARKRHSDVGCRIEFTLARSRAVRLHLGGDQLDDLLTANLPALFKRHLHVEEVDFERLGRLFSPKTVDRPRPAGRREAASWVTRQMDDAAYRARRAAHHVIKVLDQADWVKPPHRGEDILHRSPAHIKGLLRRYFIGPLDKPLERKVKVRKGQEQPDEPPVRPVPKRIQKWVRKKRTGSLAGRRNALTIKKLEACFTAIPFEEDPA